MNPLGLAARITVAVALFVALLMSFVSSFLVMSIDIGGLDVRGVSTGLSAWHRSGVLGGLAMVVGLPLAVAASALPTSVSVARRVLSAVAGAVCMAAALLFVLYLVVTNNDLASGLDDVQIRFGWSGYATLAALAVGVAAAVLAAVLSDTPTPPTLPGVQPPPSWA
jgi:hypothetical protein